MNYSISHRKNETDYCLQLQTELLEQRNLIIASNRGPVVVHTSPTGETSLQRGAGGLVTALSSLAKNVEATWVASALTEGDRRWDGESVLLEDGNRVKLQFVCPDEAAYDGYYNVIANPLLWFLQHSMWDVARAPTISQTTWQAWREGYVTVNRLFAEAIAKNILSTPKRALVMLQDYHLYLTSNFLRQQIRSKKEITILHFVHIPWPGPEDWGMLPPEMRKSILDSLTAADLLGFQTRDDGLNFLRTIEAYLPGARVNYRKGKVSYRNHALHVRDYPISIDVQGITRQADSEEVAQFRAHLEYRFGERQLIVRVDRTEPSKNIVRGFQAFDEMLDRYPEHRGKVQFLAILVPSRMEVYEYQSYLDELMAAAGRVNVKHGDSDWEPVRVLVGENYARAIAALQMYDVLLVNSLADGMNLVAKEGPTVNQRSGVVVLSERTGARQQLEQGALIIPPLDITSTAEALHQGLTMPLEERQRRADLMAGLVRKEDIYDWLCKQLDDIKELGI